MLGSVVSAQYAESPPSNRRVASDSPPCGYSFVVATEFIWSEHGSPARADYEQHIHIAAHLHFPLLDASGSLRARTSIGSHDL
jgi:hypothetical protein